MLEQSIPHSLASSFLATLETKHSDAINFPFTCGSTQHQIASPPMSEVHAPCVPAAIANGTGMSLAWTGALYTEMEPFQREPQLPGWVAAGMALG